MDPLTWALQYRIIDDKPFRIKHQPFLEHIYEDQAQKMVIMKGAQVGVSEYAINKSLWFLENCGDVLYVLPTDGDASDFSAGRINPAIEESSHLEELFTDVDNVGHKRAGNRNYYLRGSNSRSKLKSVPIDFLVLDEYDEMIQRNIPLARRRLDASPYKWELMISTPTFPETGIHAEYLKSDQHVWMVTCKACGEDQELTWPESVKNGEFVCKACGEVIDRWNGRWVSKNPGGSFRGYHISQLISPTITAKELEQEWNDAQGNASKLEDFYNSKLGLPYVPEGDQLTADLVRKHKGGYQTFETFAASVMGVDVGSELHYVISIQGESGKRTVIRAGTVQEFEELDLLMDRYSVYGCVVDALPETREARKFADRFPGKVYLAYYTDPREGLRIDEKKSEVHIARTEAIDGCFSRFFNGTIEIPVDVPEDFILQHTKLVRTYETNSKGQQVAVYRKIGADHYAHANTYCEIAFVNLKKNTIDPGMAEILRGAKIYG